MQTEWSKITSEEFAGWFRCEKHSLGPDSLSTLEQSDLRWRQTSKIEAEEYILEYIKKLEGEWIERDREQNREAWSRGWTENLEEVRSKGPSALTCRPRYFRGSRFLRLQQDIVVTPNHQIEHDLLTATRQYLFSQYLNHADTICEIGCGSGQNLWLLSEMFPDKKIIGLDWVQPCVDIAEEIAKTGRKVSAKLFDMVHPDPDYRLPENTAIISIHALEQIGNQHSALINWILAQKPSIVLQHEPTVEFYDSQNLYDALALWYSKKRRYLEGYLTALRKHEEQQRLRILSSFRPKVGGVFHEASVLIWKPL